MTHPPVRLPDATLTVDPRRPAGTGPLVEFHRSTELWDGLEPLIQQLLDDSGARKVAELGGGANPSVEVVEGRDVELTVIDISPSELDKAPVGVPSLCADLAAADFTAPARFDMVFSRMLAEHVGSGEHFHRNCYQLLEPGGLAVHFSPVLGSLPFVVNRVMPERLAHRILVALFPERADEGSNAKFPASYSWCRGPSSAQIRRLEGIGFEPLAFFVGFGHGYYQSIPVLRDLETAKSRALVAHPAPQLAAYVVSVLRRPANAVG